MAVIFRLVLFALQRLPGIIDGLACCNHDGGKQC